MLSQWRGYSRGESGVSVGISLKDLFDFFTDNENGHFWIHRVIYDVDVQKSIIQEIIRVGMIGANNLYKKFNNIMIERDVAVMVTDTLKYFIPLFKDISFLEEKEWRYVSIDYNESKNMSSINFRVRDNIILPFIKIPLKDTLSKHKGLLPINEVIVGPSMTQSFTVSSIKYLFEQKGYYVDVRPSKIPYR